MVLELFRNSAVICSSEKIPAEEVDKYQINWYLCPLFHFDALYGLKYVKNISSCSLKKHTNWDNLVCLSSYIFWMIKFKSKHTSPKKYTNWDKVVSDCVFFYGTRGSFITYFGPMLFLNFWVLSVEQMALEFFKNSHKQKYILIRQRSILRVVYEMRVLRWEKWRNWNNNLYKYLRSNFWSHFCLD